MVMQMVMQNSHTCGVKVKSSTHSVKERNLKEDVTPFFYETKSAGPNELNSLPKCISAHSDMLSSLDFFFFLHTLIGFSFGLPLMAPLKSSIIIKRKLPISVCPSAML